MNNDTIHSLTLPMGQLAYYDIGEGQPIVLLHGFPDTPLTFRHQILALNAQGYRCLVPYMPGYGDSTLPRGGEASVLAIANMVHAFISHIAPQQQVCIYGHDWGSIIAQCISSFHYNPQTALLYTLHKLILCAVPPVRYFLRNLNMQQLYRSRYMAYFQLPHSIPSIQHTQHAYIRTLWARWSPRISANDPQLAHVLHTLATGNGLHHAIAYYRYALNPFYLAASTRPTHAVWHLFRRKALPCLIVVGQEDGCIGKELFKNSVQGYPHPHTRLVEIADAGHFTHYEQPERFNQVLLDFLSPPSTH